MQTDPSEAAQFTLFVHRFRNIFTTSYHNRGTPYQMKMDNSHPLVEAIQDDEGFVKHIIIHPGRLTIRFQVASNDNERNYSPVGIAFVRKTAASGPDVPKIGRYHLPNAPVVAPKQFPPHEMKLDEKSRAVSITAEFPGQTTPDKSHYEFFLIIQCDETGALGIIDPPLDHEH